MRKIDRRIVVIISVIFILGLAWGLMKFLEAQKEPPPVRRAIEARRYVKAEPVKYTNIAAEVSGPGRLASIAEVDIVAEASGKIEAGNVSLKKGASFSKGDILFRVYPDEAILSLKARKSQYQNILASRNVISEYYNIQSDQLQLSRRTVRAPFKGTFKEVYMELGAYTNTGGRVARAIRTDEMELVVPLKRADAAWVRPGDPVSVQSENLNLSWKGKVLRKSQYVEEKFQSQEVYVKIPYDNKQPLLAGEYLVASFPVRPILDVMEIPRNSVFNSNEVFIVTQGRLSKRTINVIKSNDRTLIFNGLIEGDSIVLQQLINVSEGTRVLTNKAAPGKPGKGPGAAAEGKKANS